MQAKRTEELKALKERHQREVAALEQQLQEAAHKPRKQARKGRAGSPGSGESALPGEALQQENAGLKQQVQELQLAADHLKAELSALKEQAQREAASAAECIAESSAALQAQVAATQTAEEALNSCHASHHAEMDGLRDSLRAAAVRDQQAAQMLCKDIIQEVQAVTEAEAGARQQIRVLKGELTRQAIVREATDQRLESLQAEKLETAKTIAELQLRLSEESSAKEAAERAAHEAREALGSFRATAEAREAEHEAEVDASRAAWEAERPRLEEQQAQLEEMRVQLEVICLDALLRHAFQLIIYAAHGHGSIISCLLHRQGLQSMWC